MKHRALIVDDDDTIQESVGDIVMSLGHEFDCAANVEEARSLLDQREYAYVLLDLEIPVRTGSSSLSRTENGQNLLDGIRTTAGMHDLPVIVMTAHGCDGPDLAVDQMRRGATDFVNKPFEGGRLDDAIHRAVAKRSVSNGRAPSIVEIKSSDPAKPFGGGMLVIHENRAELCGVTVAEASRRGHAWRIVQCLAEKTQAGNFRAYSGQQLASWLGRKVNQNSVSQCTVIVRGTSLANWTFSTMRLLAVTDSTA